MLERITHFQFGTMMPSGAVHPIIYANAVTYVEPEARMQRSSAIRVSVSSVIYGAARHLCAAAWRPSRISSGVQKVIYANLVTYGEPGART